MNIDRTNYEEFFLLYVDNELSAAEKNAVDIFLQQNTDLQEEMLMLKQSVVKPDTIIFNDKSKLLIKKTFDERMQEKLLLYLDGETNKKDKAFIEQLLKTDDTAKAEWDILTQTKTEADTSIVFKEKHLLYKEETGRVIGFRWWRVAAAALLIGFGIWGAITYSSKNNPQTTGDYVQNNPVKESSKPAEAITPAKEQSSTAILTTPVITKKQEDIKQSNKSIQQENNKAASLDENNIAITKEDDDKPVVTETYKPYLEKLNNTESNNNTIAIVTPEKQQSKITDLMNTTKQTDKSMLDNNDVAANKLALLTTLTEDSENNEGEKFEENNNRRGRTKVGAFLKKVKRMIERKTNTENSDNKIKIANLSFAVQ